MKKIAITGHTRGIGLALAERLDQENYEVRGYSKSNGFNILRPNGVIKDIVDWDADVFVNNAYAPEALSRLLYKIYEQWVDKP